MERKNLDRNRTIGLFSNRIISQEEYNALMSELAQAALPKALPPISKIDEKFRRLEFNLMVLVGLILVISTLCQHS